jgi:hypothetical protein
VDCARDLARELPVIQRNSERRRLQLCDCHVWNRHEIWTVLIWNDDSKRWVSCITDLPKLFSITVDAVNRVRNGESVPFRPTMPCTCDCPSQFLDIIKHCWDEKPDNRPYFPQIKSTMRKLVGKE